jgi:hypothetical protein
MKIYKVKSKSNKFKPFTIKDNELGYLDFNIYNKIALLFYGSIGKIIGYRGSTRDIVVKPTDRKKWFSIKYKRNSSEHYLFYKNKDNTKTEKYYTH